MPPLFLLNGGNEMLFMSKSANLKLNVGDSIIRFKDNKFSTNDEKVKKAIEESDAFKRNDVIAVRDEEVKQPKAPKPKSSRK